jgi:BTB/POZ domain
MTWILQYIYSGQVAVPEAKFADFLTTAKMLQISTLDSSQVNLITMKLIVFGNFNF